MELTSSCYWYSYLWTWTFSPLIYVCSISQQCSVIFVGEVQHIFHLDVVPFQCCSLLSVLPCFYLGVISFSLENFFFNILWYFLGALFENSCHSPSVLRNSSVASIVLFHEFKDIICLLTPVGSIGKLAIILSVILLKVMCLFQLGAFNILSFLSIVRFSLWCA